MVHHTLKGCPHISDAQYIAKLKTLCTITESGCWDFNGFIHPSRGMEHRGPRWGYGSMSYRGKSTKTHHVAYRATRGPIPKGMVVMHKCDLPRCCNPDHITVGTQKQNQMEMSARKRAAGQWKTHCKRGHPLSGDNLAMKRHHTGALLRFCKTCNLVRQRVKAGWPLTLANTMGRVRPGYTWRNDTALSRK